MAIDVETKDCTALGDAELAEMADICAGGPGRLRGRAAVQAARGVGARHPGPRRQQAAAASRSARSSASAARPACWSGLASVKRDAKRDAVLKAHHGRPVPPGACWPSPTRTCSSAPASSTPPASRPSRASKTSCPAPATRPRVRSGRGAAGWPSASAPRAASTTAPSWSAATATRCGALDHETLKPEAITADVAAYFKRLDNDRGDYLIAFGWAMAEDLAAGKLGK